MAKVLQIQEFGIEQLKVEERDMPAPGPREVKVRFHAASLNYRDLMTVDGRYNPKLQLPRIPGSDAAGEVLGVGSEVTDFQPGDRIASTFFQRWDNGPATAGVGKTALGGAIDGVFATERVLPDSGIIAIPPHLSFAEAATIPCAGVTAWAALVKKGSLHAGETVLVLGTGGVSIWALQIAKAHGARVIITSSSDEKLVRARALGADETINYRSHPDWQAEVLRLTGGRGAEHIVEVGGAGTLPQSFEAAALNGHVYIIGVLTGLAGVDLSPVLRKQLHVDGVYVGSRSDFHALNQTIVANELKPVIDHNIPLSEAQKAFHMLQSGSHFGKIVLDLNR